MTRTFAIAALLVGFAGCGGDASSNTPIASSVDTAPTAAACAAGERVTVTVVVDGPGDRFYGLHTRLRYPAGLDIPGTRDDASVRERVVFVPVDGALAGGDPLRSPLPTYNDEDTDFDGVDDRIQTLMSSLDDFADGPFVTITFDCAEGRAHPVPDDFPCEVAGAADFQFMEVLDQSTCHAELGPAR